MGITVVSSASLNLPGKGASPMPPADSGGGADFAALLTQQLVAPQALDLQAKLSAGLGTAPRDPAAEIIEDDPAAEQDASALLAAAGLLPGLAATPKTEQPQGDAALSAKRDAGQDDIAGIIGQLNRRGDDQKADPLGAGQDGLKASLGGDLLGKDSANIAAAAEPGSGNGQNFAATLAAQSGQAQRTQAGTDGTASATVATPLHDSRWSQDFGDKVVWLAKTDQQVAQLHINPPQLGPMHITLNLNGDQASALFVSAHAEVRQAIQDAMPQLREMLAGAGINLGQANVGTQLPQQNGGEQPRFSSPARAGDDNAILRADSGPGTAAPLTAVRAGRGMVDLFA
ncbi:MAG TPA: flagellar hook-length control protein FliK [Rhodocyclaceae bacterium]|nr:flagellar hook-length control protein FliK [Rhodocyclaceae bacterium]